MAVNKPLIILDACVIIKWIVGEDDSDKALAYYDSFLHNEIRLAVPSLCFYDTMNVLSVKHKPIALKALNYLLNLKMDEFVLDMPLTLKALEIVNSLPKIAFYDAVYHALAIMHKGTFLTADKSYFDKAKKLKHIKLLV